MFLSVTRCCCVSPRGPSEAHFWKKRTLSTRLYAPDTRAFGVQHVPTSATWALSTDNRDEDSRPALESLRAYDGQDPPVARQPTGPKGPWVAQASWWTLRSHRRGWPHGTVRDPPLGQSRSLTGRGGKYGNVLRKSSAASRYETPWANPWDTSVSHPMLHRLRLDGNPYLFSTDWILSELNK